MVGFPSEPNHVVVEPIQVELDENKTLPSTEEMLRILQCDPTHCLSWL